MTFGRKQRDRSAAAALIAGLAIGAAAGIFFGWREWRRRRRAGAAPDTRFEAIENATVEALREDDQAGRRAIDVAGIGAGIIELTGTVEDADEARRAVDIAQRIVGVHTVVNRLAVGTVERHIVRTRRRFQSGDAALTEAKWYGMGVGMGRRRQSAMTEPDRPDDRAERVTRVLEPSPEAEDTSSLETGTATELSSEEAGFPPARKRRGTGPTH